MLTLVLTAAVAALPAAADETFNYDPSEPMQFFSAGDGGNCNGCSWVAAEGTIQRDTPEVFRRFLAKGRAAIDIRFNSPGGDLTAAMRLGEMIREQGMHSSVGKTSGTLDADGTFINIVEGGWDSGHCAAACVLAFLGGVRRHAEGGELGLRQLLDPEPIKEPKGRPASESATEPVRAADQAMMGRLIDYVLRMDGSPRLLAVAASTRHQMRWLTRQEVVDLGIEISDKYSSPMTVEPFGIGGAYVEILNRSTFVSFRLRLYCRGDASTVHLTMIPNWKYDGQTFEPAMREIMQELQVFLVGDHGRRSFPLKLVALEPSPLGPQTTAQIVGATMTDLQAAKRIEILYDGIGNVNVGIAMGLEFDLAGDRRKIGIVARSCVK
ncbi:hypothetical protein ACQR16_11020 [Bradyrhizobium oligotrophicum]|uniref:hypothetical protein n=1 Tax=Bradyrhizobium oligotrophicum TaxID=44255 RepID=UPI003EC077BD